MAYRTFKRFVGETSLERKCRFLFGASLLLLILGSFLWCSGLTSQIVFENPRSTCRRLVQFVVLRLHAIQFEADETDRSFIEDMANALDDMEYDHQMLTLDAPARDYLLQPADEELERLNDLRDRYVKQLTKLNTVDADDAQAADDDTSPSGSWDTLEYYNGPVPVFADNTLDNTGIYVYYQPVYWKEKCLDCHQTLNSDDLGELATDPNATRSEMLAAMPFRAVRISLPTKAMDYVHKVRAFLIAMGIVTVFLSMVALYIVVRYVIVKPLQHLQEISEQVEQGNYDARAQIETRDEFEDLAGAFNRMLRHMVETQAELKTANNSLDFKVDELAQANMQLYELNRLKSEFLATVSHELRTPLNSIIGFSDLLGDMEALDDKQKRYVGNIGNQGKTLLELINDILDLAKMESGKLSVRPSEFSIGTVLQAQIDVVRKLAEDKNIDVSFQCPGDLPVVFQDQAKIQQILTNLLSNAIKFTPDGGRISVVVDPVYDSADDLEAPDKLAFTVQDTGIGIAEEDHDVVFEKFRQATPHRGEDNLTREYSGTGLGLSIIKELCKLLGGEVTFKSQLGHGSAFTITLPWILRLVPENSSDDSGVTDFGAVGGSKPKLDVASAPASNDAKTDTMG